ncbi:MAG: sensor histidine kinase [Solirubrobacteraceae bacterium]
MSLRARLLAGLLTLAAIGLVVLGGVTYAEQRSFLFQQKDQQARSAAPIVGRQLDVSGINVPGSGDGGQRHGGPGRDGFGPGPGGDTENLPPGTYGERRDASGTALGHVVLSYGQRALAAPRIPRKLPLGELTTVSSARGDELRYRVVSFVTPDQPGTTVVAIPLAEADQTLDHLLLVEAIVIGGVLLALALLSWFLVGLGLRPLDRMARTAGQIAAGELSQRVTPATERTEVGRLGLALNAMLARIEEAFGERQASEDRLRRFLADASHELRTPLVSIRGYAELFRIGATRDEAEVEKAMARIEQEAARMGVLVEDLLALARLDEVREPVRERVDVGQLARDALADARATAPDRPMDLEMEGEPLVLGDPDQLRQVLANLLRNALTHTPAGTAIEVSVRGSEHDVCLEVRDHGQGLPSSEPDLLFERFWRADAGRARGRGGAGLGLAIVAAIVAAHGGDASAKNAEGGGASFAVRLPALSPQAAPATVTTPS